MSPPQPAIAKQRLTDLPLRHSRRLSLAEKGAWRQMVERGIAGEFERPASQALQRFGPAVALARVKGVISPVRSGNTT